MAAAMESREAALGAIAASLAEAAAGLRALLGSDAPASNGGLLGYEGLARELAVDGRVMTDRNVKSLAAKYRKILRPVKLGHRTVGFRRADVEKLKAYLAGDRVGGGL